MNVNIKGKEFQLTRGRPSGLITTPETCISWLIKHAKAITLIGISAISLIRRLAWRLASVELRILARMFKGAGS